ncbi:hypothetical protein [Nakamurella panacisegetis]|uniref:hypothetical protein n=1 Tax=Nakamurella panacisegetis TaxID=1090615 RepID=UPI00156074F2|nr:hypothetical protein [Nakamurella panacisegetis]
MIPATVAGDLRLGHILAATGIDLGDIVILRHTVNLDPPTGGWRWSFAGAS